MARAISRESFDELKNYLGVYLQQGRVVLDADWNENQDIAVSFLRRLAREAIGEGSPNSGFAISPAFPPQLDLPDIHIDSGGDPINAIAQLIGTCLVDLITLSLQFVFGSIPFFLNFPGSSLDDFEQIAGWSLAPNIGNLRLGQDRPYRGKSFLRLSGHTANVLTETVKTLPAIVDISSFDLATFRFRLNQQVPGDYNFFLEDDSGNRSIWRLSNSALAKEFWLSGFASPLDLAFHILSSTVLPGFNSQDYSSPLACWQGQIPSTWSISGGPPWLKVEPNDDVTDQVVKGRLFSDPAVNGGNIPANANGVYTFNVTATDASGATDTRPYTLKVTDPPDPDDPRAVLTALLGGIAVLLGDMFPTLMNDRVSTNGTAANLTRIKKYGFAVYQDAQPLVWDFDDLQLGSIALQRQMGENNFIIRGSEMGPFLNTISLLSLLQGGLGGGGGGSDPPPPELQNLLDLMNADFNLQEPSIETAGRMYVDGFPCVQVDDVLYSQQADPNDPPLVEPSTGVRTDTVYLDAWTEPVTYVDDPEIRELALGGPDTSTRLALRQRVRVNQGGGMPRGDGRGLGTLATAGSYTGLANRLYLVEIDGAGDIGAATCRWSEDNGATIGRVIAPIPPGSTKVVLEDASAFAANDKILIRKQFGVERHVIASVFSNVLSLQQPTGAQLALLPAAAADPSFTAFSLADRPMVQRWNEYGLPILPDPADSTISAAIALNDGVEVRFGGRAMRAGDFWNFRTRYLAGDPASGLDPDARIEPLSYQAPRGVIHHYAELAQLTRDAASIEPKKIGVIRDRRQRAGNASTIAGPIAEIHVTDNQLNLAGGVSLPVMAPDSKVVVFWTGTLFIHSRASATSKLIVQVSFYNEDMTDPELDPDAGKIQDRVQEIPLGQKPLDTDVPLSLNFVTSGLDFAFLPAVAFRPTSVQLLFRLSDATGSDVEVTEMQLFALELKKSF
jgi:hypothetical protein